LQISFSKVHFLYALFGSFIVAIFSLGFSSTVSAHGYVDEPQSRALLCEEGENFDCGGVEHEPQSVEGPGNFPDAGVDDGEIASGGGVFPELDEQGEDRWAKVPMSSGAYTFHWTLTAAHATDNWDYYVTKEDWDPNTPLKRSDLELFCSYDDEGARPDFSVSHDCEIPDREGYHVILAYWEVADTANAFYQVIDANFDGEYVEPEEPGDGDNGDGDNGDDNEADAWDESKAYLSGDEVTYDGDTYRAKWWTQGDNPADSNAWELVSEDSDNGDEDGENGNEPDAPAWNEDTIYLEGDLVTYDDDVYKAAWWTQGEQPDDSAVWQLQ